MVADLGGEIRYQSSADGTTVFVSLPLHHNVEISDVA
jgi:signal transduction histidine kinase